MILRNSSLQILVGAAIGAAKHANKKLNYPARSEAASAIAQLLEHHPLANVSAQEMKGAIGMRNAIVHDYFNLDWELIQAVLEEQKYKKVGLFVEHCCKLLGDSTD
ncbi:HepT-like ribonuclease domain-containing protein [Microbulbifer sp. HZ11]|uniref:type VII toxin-antitoxin system HepT family RNase toxin n=1 Tax=Microbulbifer sp. HZ11 TaxID=1453501 RepID=UPI0005B8997E|nr:HepT-like ribonuclease domain-containing protein [Microbulbifer sp. HZ11]